MQVVFLMPIGKRLCIDLHYIVKKKTAHEGGFFMVICSN